MNVAVITWYHYRNYGTALQSVAMVTVLRDMGYMPKMICYKPNVYTRSLPDYRISAVIKRAYNKFKKRDANLSEDYFCNEKKDKLFDEFLNSHIVFTEDCLNKSDLEMLNDQFDAFVCGSDQIWSPLFFNPRYFLDFVSNRQKMIAYAPSLGVDSIKDYYVKNEMRKLLGRFDVLSVREAVGQHRIKELVNKDAQVVLDPTLLLTALQWKELCGIRREDITDKYLLVYLLGNNPKHWKSIHETARKLKLMIKIIPVYNNDLIRNGCIEDAVGPKEFLQLIHSASYMCTDSYHGLAFALQFHIPFTAFMRFENGEDGNQNSRVLHLLKMSGTSGRLAKRENKYIIRDKSIDFYQVDAVIGQMRSDSKSFLNSMIESVKEEKQQPLHVKEYNSLCCGCGACKTVCPALAIDIVMTTNGFWEADVNENKCIRCGKCVKACPFCTKTKSNSAAKSSLYSFKCNDAGILLRSSSGGAGYSIANEFLNRNYRIAGCKYDTHKQRAEHILIQEKKELYAIQGSKYLQSNFSSVLSEIVQNDNPVVIFGTPCQIAGAKRVLLNQKNVVYVDLVCHGVPSSHLYNKYKAYIEQVFHINSCDMKMSFRYKPRGWSNIHLYATDGINDYCCKKDTDPFFRMFETGVCYSNACYECRWRVDSEADIRLGDYWGPKFQLDQTGVNMVICFTQKGLDVVEKLCVSETAAIKREPVDDYLMYQQSMNPAKPVFYDNIIEQLRDVYTDINDIVDKYVIPLENKQLSKVEHMKYVLKMAFISKLK